MSFIEHPAVRSGDVRQLLAATLRRIGGVAVLLLLLVLTSALAGR